MNSQHFARTAGFWCIVGATVATLGAIVTGSIPSSVPTTNMSFPFSPTTYAITQLIWAGCQTLMFLGTLGLARSGAVGVSRLGQIGIWITLAGMAAIVPCVAGFAFIASETVDSTAATAMSSAIGLASTLSGLGFLLVGIAVLRAGRWHGWQRFTPLLCGLYVFVALTPILAAFPALVFWAIAGWNATFILLGLALYGQRAASHHTALSTAPA
jgi:hypothetical protein